MELVQRFLQRSEGLFDVAISNEDGLEDVANSLSGYIFSKGNQVNGEESEGGEGDYAAQGEKQDPRGDEAGSAVAAATSNGIEAEAAEDESMEDAPADRAEGNDDMAD